MKKIIYFIAICLLAGVAVADDHIIRIVLKTGHILSLSTSDIASIRYEYHNQDSIDQAYADSVARDQFIRDSLEREAFVRDSLYNDSIQRELAIRDSLAKIYTLGNLIDSTDSYSIFTEAMHRTGLADSVRYLTKRTLTFRQLYRQNFNTNIYPANGPGTTGTLDDTRGYTIFAENDSVMKANGINSFDDLVQYANSQYQNCAEWYDYISENNITISTGNDYDNRYNALNMFMAYHILKASMYSDQLVYERGRSPYWNYAPDADPYDYYETMLPHTLMKIWEPHNVGAGRTLFINRYQTYNTLTDEVGTMGTNHTVMRQGIKVERNNSIDASNGHLHPISDMLVYDRLVPRGVLNERMRVNCTSLFPELISNGFRYWSVSDGSIPYMYDTSRMGIPSQYFDNLVLYDDNVCFAYCLHGAWRCYQSDQLQLWGRCDMAFKLPAVPSGEYELRMIYAPMAYGSVFEFSLGTNPDDKDGFSLIKSVDYSVSPEDPRIGLTNALEEADRGVASDAALRANGYMRAPYSYCGHAESTGWTQTNNGRFEWGSSSTLRIILGRVKLTQGADNWLRIRNTNPDSANMPFGIDFVELMPVSVLENQQYSEDWY